MRKIKAYIDTGCVGCHFEEEFEFEDNVPDYEIEEEVKDWVFQYINWNWEEI